MEQDFKSRADADLLPCSAFLVPCSIFFISGMIFSSVNRQQYRKINIKYLRKNTGNRAKSNNMKKIEASDFKRLIGIWKTEGKVFSGKDKLKLAGTDSYEFILDGNFILHKAAVKMGKEKNETFEIIALDGSVEKGKMDYYNSKAATGVMTCSLIENDFKIKGDKIKFVGTINDESTKLSGKWSKKEDSGKWNGFIELELTKQN
jgi:hypothetical protein